MITAESPDDLSPVWRALADPTRRALLDLLRTQPMITGDLARHFAISRFGIMKHLQILVDARLVLVRRRGRNRWNHLNPVPMQQIYRRWIRPFEAKPADAVVRVKHIAEQGLERGEQTDWEEQMGPIADSISKTAAARFRTVDVQLEIHINASPDGVWRALTEQIAAWWPKAFYVGSTPRAFVLEPRVGGRVYEDWGDGQGMLFAFINGIRQGEMLQWVGDMGPDYGGPARTMSTFRLKSDGDGTVLSFRDTPYGKLAEGAIEDLEQGWTFLLTECFKPYVETGRQPDRPETLRP